MTTCNVCCVGQHAQNILDERRKIELDSDVCVIGCKGRSSHEP